MAAFKEETFISICLNLCTPAVGMRNILSTRKVVLLVIVPGTVIFGFVQFYISSPVELGLSFVLSSRVTFAICPFSATTLPQSAIGTVFL